MTEKETKAIETLQARIEAINAKNFDPVVWTDQTCIHIKRIFGTENNERIKQLKDISYSIPTPMVGSDIQSRRRKKGKQQAKNYLLGYIEEIKNYGLESEGNDDLIQVKKSNFQTLGKNIAFWSLILVLVGGAFTLGMYFGKSNFDKEKMDYYQRNLKLENEIDSLQNKINVQNDTIKKLNAENKTLNE